MRFNGIFKRFHPELTMNAQRRAGLGLERLVFIMASFQDMFGDIKSKLGLEAHSKMLMMPNMTIMNTMTMSMMNMMTK
jgi:hypothetical protein